MDYIRKEQLKEVRSLLDLFYEELPNMSYSAFKNHLNVNYETIQRLVTGTGSATEEVPHEILCWTRKACSYYNIFCPDWIPYYIVEGEYNHKKFLPVTKDEYLTHRHGGEPVTTRPAAVVPTHLGKWASEKDAHKRELEEQIARLQHKLAEVERPPLTVSEHAVVQYLGRVKGMDIDAIRQEILTDELYNAVADTEVKDIMDITTDLCTYRISREGNIITIM